MDAQKDYREMDAMGPNSSLNANLDQLNASTLQEPQSLGSNLVSYKIIS